MPTPAAVRCLRAQTRAPASVASVLTVPAHGLNGQSEILQFTLEDIVSGMEL